MPKQKSPASRNGRAAEQDDPVVFRIRKRSECGKCRDELFPGRMVKLEGTGNERIALCKSCSGLGEYYYVPAGDAKLTRLISKYCPSKHVVLRWSATRKRYERQGVLVELEALNRAEAELGLPLTTDKDSEIESEDIKEQ